MSRYQDRDDLCSTVSTISSCAYFEDEGEEEYGDIEIKYEPARLKVEILETEGGGNDDEEYEPEMDEDWGQRVTRAKTNNYNNARKARGATKKLGASTSERPPPKTMEEKRELAKARMQRIRLLRKSESNTKINGMTLEEDRAKDKERKRLGRLREKERKELQGLVDNGEGDKVVITGDLESDEENVGRRKTRSSGMTTTAKESEKEKEKKKRVGSQREKQKKKQQDDEVVSKEGEPEKCDKRGVKMTRKKISEMSPEEAERTRNLWRDRRKEKKGAEKKKRGRKKKKVSDSEEETSDEDEDCPIKKQKKEKSASQSKCKLYAIYEDGIKVMKSLSEMTDEQKEMMRAKWKAASEKWRQRSNEGDERGNDSDEEENSDEDDKVNKQKKKQKGALRSRANSSYYVYEDGLKVKKPFSEMTDEQKAELQAKWRANSEKWRQRVKDAPPAAKKEHIQKSGRKLSLKDDLTEEQKRRVEERYRKDRERQKAYRDSLTADQKRERSQKVVLCRLARKAKMSEEELQMKRVENYMQYQARKATLPPEEIEREKERKRARMSKKWEEIKNTPGGKERWNEKQKLYRNRKRAEKAKEFGKDGGEAERLREQRHKNGANKRERRKKGEVPRAYTYSKAAQDQIKMRRMMGGGSGGRLLKNMTEEQRREWRNLQQRKTDMRRKLKIQSLLDSGMTMEEIMEHTDTPEKRERRLILQRIKKKRRQLRETLWNSGARQQEIEEKVKEMEASYQPVMQFRPYKPQPERWKRVNPSDLGLLTDQKVFENFISAPKLSPPKQIGVSPLHPVHPPPPPPLQKAPRKRGRPSTKSQSNQDDLSPAPPLTIHQLCPQQQYSSSPSAAVVASGTGYSQQYYQTPASQYHLTAPLYPNPQSQSCSLQTILDGIEFQENSGVVSISAAQQPTSNQYTAEQSSSASGSHYADHDHASDDYTSANNYSPPPASPPGGGDDDDDNYDSSSNLDESYQIQATTSSLVTSPKKKPRKGKGKQKEAKPRSTLRQRQKKSENLLDTHTVCNECGEAFNRLYLRRHVLYAHNPNYNFTTKTCLLCNVVYKMPAQWYSHFLRDHEKVPVPDKPELCQDCGKSFTNKFNLKHHQNMKHGDGKETHLKCPHCPGEKLYKSPSHLQDHMTRCHPAATRIVPEKNQCVRCDQVCSSNEEMGLHVKVDHPGSYFPCDFCHTVRFSQLGLNFHYGRCAKIANEKKNELLESWDASKGPYFRIDLEKIQCQFCEKRVNMSSLRRHYLAMHGAREDKQFVCPLCKKEFNLRHFLAAHWEEIHCKPVEEIWEYLRELHASNREGLTEEPKSLKRTRDGRSRKSGKKIKSGESEDDASDEGDKGQVRLRRNVVVICDEDKKGEQEEN